MKKLLLALVAVASSASVLAQSAVPNLISYQGRIADAAGVLVGSTAPVNRIVLFRVYDSPSLSAPANRLYSEQQTVTIANGEFSVLVGSGTAISTENTNAFSTLSAAVFGGATRYLGVTVDDGDGNPNNDPESSPRQQIVSAPFAFRAQVAEAVGAGGVNALAIANASVGTAALAPAAVTNDKLAANAVGAAQIASGSVGTGQVADGALTLAKLASDSIDGSKIVDGSIQLADLSPAARATFPKTSVVYNQGLGAFVKGPQTNSSFTVFPIDLSDLGVDGEVMISYLGAAKTGIGANALPTLPSLFSGRVRVMLPNFAGGSVAGAFATGVPSANTGAALAAPTTNIPFIAYHEGLSPSQTYSVTGILAPTSNASASFNTTQVYELTASTLTNPAIFRFPKVLTSWFQITLDSTGGVFGQSAVGGNFFATPPVAHAAVTGLANAYPTSVGGNSSVTGVFMSGNATERSAQVLPLFYIVHYYPGLVSGLTSASTPYHTDIANVTTTNGHAGAPQALPVSSVQTGTNKLTLTVANPHIIQVGDTVVIAGMTGTPSANGTYTVAAVPSTTTFEIPLVNAAGTYTGGTITHTPTYNKYRFWVVVHAAVNVRVTVSDK